MQNMSPKEMTTMLADDEAVLVDSFRFENGYQLLPLL